ncbi:helix-turn-helix domain-containing protein [Enterococcus sp. DIV0187]|uniref:helix-turn-helix domain-containing protein n=1 Tax=Enterococcus sp. DIV0187 TaxID=2774644 RepID=UPI003F21EFC7
MSQIILFTNNPLNESIFEERLRQLGHEVFTTKGMLERCLLKEDIQQFICMFHQIILSETLANAEVKELVQKLKRYSLPIFRITDGQLEEAELEEWRELGVSEWFESQPSIETLREKLCSYKVKEQGNVVFLTTNEKKRALSSLTLSNGEEKLFYLLYEQRGQTIPRDELCLRLWNRSQSNSTMSQLSVMVKHLKDKLYRQDITGPIIETCWGQGYRLHETVYEQVFFDVEERKYGND